ncbi:DUF1566 domain-containing protein [Oxalobacteraceae bacterium]|nr:DUF1566 domain-containing protein [Oxalobacteraceae bacterium]
MIRGADGQPDAHVVLLPGDAKDVTFEQAQAFAQTACGELPTRREQSLLFANLKEEFQGTWYWSGEQHASLPSNAWRQHFDDGYQYDGRKSFEGRARAVRRFPI